MKFRYRQSFAQAQIDRANGILRGVAICTLGAAKGHGVLIDDQTLESLALLGEQAADGIRVKFNSGTFNHGAGSVIGRTIKGTFKKDGEILRADLQVMKTAPGFDYLFDLAENQPGTIGLSVEFEGEHEDISGVKYARPSTFDAAAVVDMPAANPTGLFSVLSEDTTQPTNEDKTAMDAKALKAALTEALAPINDRLSKLETAGTPDPDEAAPDVTGMSSDAVTAELSAAGVVDTDEPKARNRKVNAYRKQLNAPATMGAVLQLFRNGGGSPVPHNGGSATKPGDLKGGDPKSAFEAKITEIAATSTNGDRVAAMRLATKNFPELHKNWQIAKGVVAKKRI